MPNPKMNAAAYASSRDVIRVSLPVGGAVSSQIKFRGSPPKIVDTGDTSLAGVKVGQEVVGVGINDDFTFSPTVGFLEDILHEFSWSEKRVLVIKNPPPPAPLRPAPGREVHVRSVPGKVPLPPGRVGLWFEGSPAVLTDVSVGSPVAKMAQNKIGLVVTAIKVPGEIEVYGMLGTDELIAILDYFSDVEGRAIVFEERRRGGPVELVGKVFLPDGKVGIEFRGKPPVVAKVDGDTTLAKKVKVGSVVQRLEFPGESPYWASLGAKTLNVLLEHHAHAKGKVLVISYPNGKEKRREESHTRTPSLKVKDIRTSITEIKHQARA